MGGEMASSVIIGIHGLANKPPPAEKQEWWKQALIEGLKRNSGKTTDDLSFDFVYWADLRYTPPISLEMNSEPYYADEGTGPFPAYQAHKWVTIFNEITSVIGRCFERRELGRGRFVFGIAVDRLDYEPVRVRKPLFLPHRQHSRLLRQKPRRQ
jgi:hypothetical protein